MTPPPVSITVNAGKDETPYILLAFDKDVTEEEIKSALSVTKDSKNFSINWVSGNNESNPGADIIAGTDIIQNTKDGAKYRVVMLRLKEGGTYQVNTGSLALVKEKSEGFAVAPFEKLELTLNGNLSGQIKHAEAHHGAAADKLLRFF